MNIAIIGCGHMGTALAQRLQATHQLSFYDRNPDKAGKLAHAGFGQASTDAVTAVKRTDIIFLAIKPANLAEAAKSLKNIIQPQQHIFSLLAGTSIAALQSQLPSGRLFRMMPNLAISCGAGIIGLSTLETLAADEQAKLSLLFEPLGKVFWFPEKKIDALTSLGSSGCGFAFALIEAMIEAGIAMGFPAKESQVIVTQMLKGSLALLEDSDHHPAALKWQVTSPAGTTAAGLRKFEEHAVRAGILNTFLAAYKRAQQISG